MHECSADDHPSRQSDIDMQTWRALEDPVIPADGKTD